MKKVYAYKRVSTVRQGDGVSLEEQHDAIVRYAQKHELEIIEWFEEKQTAAKRGRPLFTRMLRLLRSGRALGVIIHKIDRSARNLKDWADLGELIDQGVDVHFANESLDLHTRGGRLSADIQAVVAADFIRNLKEETRKGIRGRLKQGLYPLPAPIGYVDKGRGKPKEINPVQGVLVRTAFELYATGRYNLDTLVQEMTGRGLKAQRGGKLTRTTLSYLLNNPFYIGLIRIKRTGEIFPGIHEPLCSKSLFDRVQDKLQGKARSRGYVHNFLFRRLLRCKHCEATLNGERQKGHVYYRCHTKGCPSTCVREEAVEQAALDTLDPLQLNSDEREYITRLLAKLRQDWEEDREGALGVQQLRLGQITDRINRLVDAYLDGAIERTLLDERKNALLLERVEAEETLASLRENKKDLPDRVTEFLELAETASLSYNMGSPEEKRELLEIITSNRLVDRKNILFKRSEPFQAIANRAKNKDGSPQRDTLRTLEITLNKVWDYFKSHPTTLDVIVGRSNLQD